MNEPNKEPLGPFLKGERAPSTTFTGTVHVNMLVTDQEYNCPIYNVTFSPGARTYWHSHPGGQILLVTAGHGWYQERGKRARALRAGDVVEIPRDVDHWHGAAQNSSFVHVGITANPRDGDAEWHGPVTEKEYDSLDS